MDDMCGGRKGGERNEQGEDGGDGERERERGGRKERGERREMRRGLRGENCVLWYSVRLAVIKIYFVFNHTEII